MIFFFFFQLILLIIYVELFVDKINFTGLSTFVDLLDILLTTLYNHASAISHPKDRLSRLTGVSKFIFPVNADNLQNTRTRLEK